MLDQAYDTFCQHAYKIPEPREILNIRIISSHPSHSRPSRIVSTDDVIIMTTTTAISNFETSDMNPKGEVIKTPFFKFLEESKKDKLFIVLDEAHHAPAYGCRNLLMNMKKLLVKHQLLGLTATPTYTDERRRGWLKKIFEDEIIFEAAKKDLQMQQILAKERYIEKDTKIEMELNDRQHNRLVREHKDVPEEIVEKIVKNQNRNDYIINEYLNNRNKYGKTIIFADRWFQCEYISDKLAKKVKVDAIYSRIDKSSTSVRERNLKDNDHNKETIEKFKGNKLDVLINVKMLTEGTDVPDVKTVFITRNTTSKILFTQMVGRAMRGKKAGGGDAKDFANIVIFSDKWKHLVHWAHHDLSDGVDSNLTIHTYNPMKYISIQLIKDLVKQMEQGNGFQPGPYRETIPLGWYKTEYTIVDSETGDFRTVREFVWVYSQTNTKFEHFIVQVEKKRNKEWEKDSLEQEWMREHALKLIKKYFDMKNDDFGGSLEDDVIHILRHIGQNNEAPKFISFDDKDKYDLDNIAQSFLKYTQLEINKKLRVLFNSEGEDLWKCWYKNYNNFKSAFDASMNRQIAIQNGELSQDAKLKKTSPKKVKKNENTAKELTEAEKKQVMHRDGDICLCCGTAYHLQVDHIQPYKYIGLTTIDNSQTLCKYCNGVKKTNHIDFRVHKSELLEAPADFVSIEPGAYDDRYTRSYSLRICIRRTVNFFYRCQALSSVELHIRKDRKYYKEWVINLYQGNNPKWLKQHNKKLLSYIQQDLEQNPVKKIKIVA